MVGSCGEGEGRGKVIITGEHFVVHGAPALVAGIDKKTRVRVERSERDEILNESWNDEKTKRAVKRAKELMGVNHPIKVSVLKEEFPPGAGLGGSAAFSAALIRALADMKGVRLPKEKVEKLAHELEKEYHGTPSGIDTCAAVREGLMIFKKGEKTFVESIKKEVPLHIVLVYSGDRERSVKDLVAHVRRIKEENPSTYENVHKEYLRIFQDVLDSVRKGDIKRVGEMLNKNHELLARLGVSSERIEKVLKEAREFGALGAKLTGAGDGGFVLALFENEEEAKRFKEHIEGKYKHVLHVVV